MSNKKLPSTQTEEFSTLRMQHFFSLPLVLPDSFFLLLSNGLLIGQMDCPWLWTLHPYFYNMEETLRKDTNLHFDLQRRWNISFLSLSFPTNTPKSKVIIAFFLNCQENLTEFLYFLNH